MWKEMFYLTMHHILFTVYRIGHNIMVKDHSEGKRGNTLPWISICIFHRQDSTHHGLCYTSCGTLAGMRNSSIGPP